MLRNIKMCCGVFFSIVVFFLFVFVLINFAAVRDDEFSASLRGCACFRRCGVKRSKQM